MTQVKSAWGAQHRIPIFTVFAIRSTGHIQFSVPVIRLMGFSGVKITSVRQSCMISIQISYSQYASFRGLNFYIQNSEFMTQRMISE